MSLSRRTMMIVSLFLLIAPPFAVAAPTLDELRSRGLVAERYDGYLVARGDPSAEVQPVIDHVNAERRAIYERRAKETNADAAQVGRVYAGEIIVKAPPGTWFLQEDGEWVQR